MTDLADDVQLLLTVAPGTAARLARLAAQHATSMSEMLDFLTGSAEAGIISKLDAKELKKYYATTD